MRFLNATTLVFLGIVAVVALWIGSGIIGREEPAAPERSEVPQPTVAASMSHAQMVTRELVLYGDVEPVQVSVLRARVAGVVEDIAAQGARVAAGAQLGQLSTDDRMARLARAEAQLAAAQSDYEAARQLAEREIGSQSEAQTRLAQLQAARAELRAIELEIANTTLQAPISGTISRIIADIGSFVSTGGEVLEIVNNDPLIAVVNVQQSQVANLRTGMAAQVRFIGGDTRDGQVRFISPIADAATRTFRVEVEVANPEGQLPAGLSAEVAIPFATVPAHRVSAALGRLGEDGRIGIHIVDDADTIHFAPIEVVRARADGIWVSGLPDDARIVTISQGSLSPGQQVTVMETPEEYLPGLQIGAATGPNTEPAADPGADPATDAIEALDPGQGAGGNEGLR